MKPFECMGNFAKASKGQTSNVTSWASPAWNPTSSVPFFEYNQPNQPRVDTCQIMSILQYTLSGTFWEIFRKFSEQVSCRLRQQSCSLKAKKSWGPFWCVETGERWHDRMAGANVEIFNKGFGSKHSSANCSKCTTSCDAVDRLSWDAVPSAWIAWGTLKTKCKLNVALLLFFVAYLSLNSMRMSYFSPRLERTTCLELLF